MSDFDFLYKPLADIGRDIDRKSDIVAKNVNEHIKRAVHSLRDSVTSRYYSEYFPIFYKRTYQLRNAVGVEAEITHIDRRYDFNYGVLTESPYGAEMMDHSFQSLQDNVRTNHKYTKIISRTWQTKKFGLRTRTYKYFNVDTYTYDGESEYSSALEDYIINCFEKGWHPHAVQGTNIQERMERGIEAIEEDSETWMQDEFNRVFGR